MFARRVEVCVTHGPDMLRHVFYAHAEHAARLCHEGAARVHIDVNDGQIRRILLARTPGNPQPGTPFSLFSYSAAQRQIYDELLGDLTAWQGLSTYTFRPAQKRIL